jgi:CRP-like cAMP-binding protein
MEYSLSAKMCFSGDPVLAKHRAQKHGQQAPEGLRIAFFMTHEEIAQNIGSSRESVSRILSDWKHRGVIRVNGGTLTITKPLELETANALPTAP